MVDPRFSTRPDIKRPVFSAVPQPGGQHNPARPGWFVHMGVHIASALTGYL